MDLLRLWTLILVAAVVIGTAWPAEKAEGAVDRAIGFLGREVPGWRRENGCFSCHNNGDGARALYFAVLRGRKVPVEALRETTEWLVHPEKWSENKGEPGFSDQTLADVQFAAALAAAIQSGLATNKEAMRVGAQRVGGVQAGDGSWRIDPQNPVGSPVTYGPALATYMGMQVMELSGEESRAGRERGERWLLAMPMRNVPAAAVKVLALGKAAGMLAKRQVEDAVAFLAESQKASGGWGPYPDTPEEVFNSALALLALSSGPKSEKVQGMIARGRRFLIGEQWEDGSWEATTRPAGGESYAQKVSTTAWATMALLATE